MAEMVPSLPEFPKWPEITWVYQNGMYCIPERYADELLDFGENALPLFQWELENYRKQIDAVLEGIKAVDK